MAVLQPQTNYNIAWCDVRFAADVFHAAGVLHVDLARAPVIIVPVIDANGHVNIGFPAGINLTACTFVDPLHKPAGLTDKGFADDGVQREYQWNRNQGVAGAVKDRHAAQRMFFWHHPAFGPAATRTISHLCHRNACMNPNHMTIEPLPCNKGRNGCAGGICCQHVVRCLMPGPQIFW